jgi:HEAT repeat protein
LIAALADEVPEVRWAAALALGRIGDSRTLEPLIAALKDEDWRARTGRPMRSRQSVMQPSSH